MPSTKYWRALVIAMGLAAMMPRSAAAAPITVLWDPNPEPEVFGYVVYIGTQSGVYTQTVDVGNVLSFTFPDAIEGSPYYFAVKAYSTGPVYSAFSNEVSGFSNAPPTLANPGAQSGTVGGAVALQLVGSDPAGEALTYGATGLPPGLTVGASTGLIAGIPTTAGAYNVTVTTSDGVLTVAQAFTWTITAPLDVTAPVVAITAPTTAATFTTTTPSVTLSGTASDNVGVTQVSWTNSRGGSGTATGTTSWTTAAITLQTGSNVLTVTARDAANNTSTDVLTVTYTDTTAPAVSITSPTSAATYTATSATITLGGTASDNVGVTQVTWTNSLGGSGTASGTASWTTGAIALQAGSNVLTVTATDAAGNTSTDVLTVSYSTADTTAPVVSITSPTSSATYTTNASTITLGGTASDAVGVTQVSWTSSRGSSGTATGTTSWTTGTITLQTGSNVLTVTARDAAGNTSTDVLTVSYKERRSKQ